MISNIANSLQTAACFERVSGYFRGVLHAALHPSMEVSHCMKVLGVSKGSIRKVFKDYQRATYNNLVSGKHSKFVTKTNYTINRLPITKNAISQWILDHCRQSLNSNKVSKTKFPNGTFQLLVKHYCETPINQLFHEFQVCILIIIYFF